ncbi:unnamed protein product [Meloidogyne enterolobii]|uniref:Uncharacterized protein n=1 Tax=Meloidogyne enterolobii TaxID=390850 RepID=A0ACB1AE62_MELEN
MSIPILFPLLLIFHCINAEITTNSKIKENSKVQLVLNEWPGAGKKMARGGLIESEGILDHLDYFETRQEASTGLKMPQTNARRCLFPWNC